MTAIEEAGELLAEGASERSPSGRVDRLSSWLGPRWLTSDLNRVVDVVAVSLVIVYTVVLMPGLTRWPPLFSDEGREANLFWVASGADPTAERMNAFRGFATWGNGGLQGATAAVIFRLGGLGLFQVRLTSLLWGGLLLLVVYWLGSRYWNRSVGLAAAALLAVSNPFLVATHTLRPDVQVVTMVLGALILAERSVAPAARRPLLLAFLAGLILGLVEDTHLNGAAFFPMVGLVFPLRQGWRRFLRQREAWLFVAGIVGAALYYLAVRFVPDPAGFMTALGYWVGVDKALPVAQSSGGGLAGRLATMLTHEVARYQDYFGEEPLELGLVVLGLAGGVWMAVRGSHPARLTLLGLAFAFVFFVVFVSTKSKYYMLLTYPLYLLLVARVLERTATWAATWAAAAVGVPAGSVPAEGAPAARPYSERARQATPLPPLSRLREGGVGGEGRSSGLAVRAGQSVPWVRAGFLAALVVIAMVWPLKFQDRAWENYIRARRYREGQDFLQLTARLNELAGPGAKILAPPVYWLGLHDHPYVDIYVYERVYRQYRMSAAQFLEETRPDFVIVDAKIATEKATEKLLYNELDARARYELIVRHKNYGDIAIYRLHW